MSVMGIASSSIFQFLKSGSAQANYPNFQKEFQQLGQDLSSGNLSAAQADFQAMQPRSSASGSTQSSGNTLMTAMKQLATDLQAGNLAGAQQDYATVKQDMSQMSGHAGHHHHPRAGTAQDSAQSPIDQLFAQLGQALQSGNVSTAQSVYSSLQQDFATLGGAASPVSVSA